MPDYNFGLRKMGGGSGDGRFRSATPFPRGEGLTLPSNVTVTRPRLQVDIDRTHSYTTGSPQPVRWVNPPFTASPGISVDTFDGALVIAWAMPAGTYDDDGATLASQVAARFFEASHGSDSMTVYGKVGGVTVYTSHAVITGANVLVAPVTYTFTTPWVLSAEATPTVSGSQMDTGSILLNF